MPSRIVLPLSAVLCFCLPSQAFSQFSALASKLHRGSNAIVAIDVAEVQQTALAQEQGWTAKLEAAYVDRAVFLPPEADKLLIASHVMPNHDFKQAWEVSVMSMSEPVSMRALARAEGGYVDQINGKETVWSPSDAYLVGLDDRTLGIVSPAHRQGVSRWIGDATSGASNQLSDYLQKAIAKVTADTQIVLAIDLEDAASPHRVESRIQETGTLEKLTSVKPEQVVQLIQSIQGATIEVSVGSEAQIKSRVDFGIPVNMSDAVAKHIVLDALENLGAQLTDLPNHEFSVLGNSIIVEGTLSTSSLRRLFSVLEIPTTKFSELDGEVSSEQANSAGNMAENSQVYFKSVVSLLDDLRTDHDKQVTRGGTDAVWMERYARKIDRLPILFVDEELLDWGSKTAETLRVMASTRRNAGLSAGSAKSALRTDAYAGSYYNYTYGTSYRYGGNSALDTEKDRNQIDRQYQNQATAKRVEGWRLIEDATSDIRRKMTQKYSVEF